MRGIVFRQGLRDPALPASLQTATVRTYPYLLDRRIPVDVIELAVPEQRALEVAMELAGLLRPQRYYAHVVGSGRMYVAFPGCVVLISRGDRVAAQRAQQVGCGFGIPLRQMRFREMFDTDHPDALPTVRSAQLTS